MTKRLVDIDDDLLVQARELLHTGTIKETVNRALREAAALAARRQFVERMTGDGLPDLLDPAVQARAWR